MNGGIRTWIGAVLLAPACFFDGDLKHDGPTAPEALGDRWQIDTPQSVGLSIVALERIHDELMREDRHLATLGFLVAKDNKLVYECYLRDPVDRDSIHHLQSATKTVTSLVVAIARDLGQMPSLEATTGELFADKLGGQGPEKARITLADLLTMRSGIDFDNGVFSLEMWAYEPDDPLRYMLERPMYAEPGERYRYRDVDPQLVGYALARLTGQSERALAERYLFGPLGIRDFWWLENDDGVQAAAHGLHLRPRDLAKIGQLVVDGGVFGGARVISEAALAEATSPKVETTTLDANGELLSYGYYFWIAKGRGVLAWGHGGQFVMVVPERRLVIVQIAMPDGGLHGSQIGDFLALVEPLFE